MRRWFQFSLSSLLILMLVVAAYFAGWRSSQLKYERELRKAAEEAAALKAANATQAQSGAWQSTPYGNNGTIDLFMLPQPVVDSNEVLQPIPLRTWYSGPALPLGIDQNASPNQR